MENNQQSVISQIYGKDGTEILIGTRRPERISDFMCHTANEFHQTHCVFVPCKV